MMEITIRTDDSTEIEGLMNAENFRTALCTMGNYLRTASDKGDSEEMVSIADIYSRFFEILLDVNLDRDIVGF